ncbi:hypothetical protein J6590_073304, partial [Homalodisca vitripennis]
EATVLPAWNGDTRQCTEMGIVPNDHHCLTDTQGKPAFQLNLSTMTLLLKPHS